MLLTLSVSSSDSISYFLLTTIYFHCVLEAILVAIYTFSVVHQAQTTVDAEKTS